MINYWILNLFSTCSDPILKGGVKGGVASGTCPTFPTSQAATSKAAWLIGDLNIFDMAKKNILPSYMLSHCPPFGIPVPLFPKCIPFRDVWIPRLWLLTSASKLINRRASMLFFSNPGCQPFTTNTQIDWLIHLVDSFDGQILEAHGFATAQHVRTWKLLMLTICYKKQGFGPSHSTSQGSAEFCIFILEK
jgi:hypothetical protein